MFLRWKNNFNEEKKMTYTCKGAFLQDLLVQSFHLVKNLRKHIVQMWELHKKLQCMLTEPPFFYVNATRPEIPSRNNGK